MPLRFVQQCLRLALQVVSPLQECQGDLSQICRVTRLLERVTLEFVSSAHT